MNATTKPQSQQDANNTLRGAYNEVDKTISVNGFLVGKVGHRVEMEITTTTVPDDTEVYTFFDNATQLYQIEVVYTDDTRETLISAERIS